VSKGLKGQLQQGSAPEPRSYGLTGFVELLGSWVLEEFRTLGGMFIFLLRSLVLIFRPPFKIRLLIRQIMFFGNRSLLIVILTGLFAGMVLALQGYYTLMKFGSEALLGPAVALSLIRELGPVLSALMVTGRAGSALTAEIGIMRISEQIDALLAMALSPIKYLVVPNILAALIAFPLLSAIFDVVGIYGGWLVAVKLLGLGSGTYFSQMEQFVDMADIIMGLEKSLCFGLLVSWVCCYKGYYAGFGAKGVSKATTAAVVLSSVLVLVFDYLIASFWL
jgi:phospholipid/cholesterol/gamma-HCH transport system permease protein